MKLARTIQIKLILVAVLCIGIATNVKTQTYQTDASSNIFLYNKCEDNAQKILTIPPNTVVKLISKTNEDWWKIEYNNQTGFVYSIFIVLRNETKKEYFSNGKIKSETEYALGIQNGIQKIFNENGKVSEVSVFINGKKNGVQKSYNNDGQLETEITFLDDHFDGAYKWFYEDGTISSICYYKNRKLNGSKITYSRDGTIDREYVYKDGEIQLEKRFHANGSIFSEIAYLNGKKNGIYKSYYESGKTESEVNYVNDNYSGNEIGYYESGKIKHEIKYENGLIVGSDKYYYENGQLASEKPFINGKESGAFKSFYENGKITQDKTAPDLNGNSVNKKYRENGNLEEETPLTNGRENGLVKRYWEDGALYSEVNYVNGKKISSELRYNSAGQLESELNYSGVYEKNGINKKFYASGKLKTETQFKDGKENGYEKRFYETGEIESEVNYVSGLKTGLLKKYFKSGKLLLECPYVNGEKQGQEKEYYEVGKLQMESNYLNGKENGIQKKYYSNGKLKEETTYINGLISGMQKKYDENGKILEANTYSDKEISAIEKDSKINATSKGEELVITGEFDVAWFAVFSPNSKILATVNGPGLIKLWDVKTGRELRTLKFKLENQNKNSTIDSLWFSSNGQFLYVQLMYDNDNIQFDIESKAMTVIRSKVVFDNSRKYSKKLQSAMGNYYQEKNTITEIAPDKIHQIQFEPFEMLMPGMNLPLTRFHLRFKNNATKTEILLKDTIGLSYYAISPNSKYAFFQNYFYDLESGIKISEIQNLNSSLSSAIFLPGSQIPLTSTMGMFRVWDFPYVKSIKNTVHGYSKIISTPDYKNIIYETSKLNPPEKYAVLFNLELLKVTDSIKLNSINTYISSLGERGNIFVTTDFKGSETQNEIYNFNDKSFHAKFQSPSLNFLMPGSEIFLLDEIESMYKPNRTYKTFNFSSNKNATMKLEDSYSVILMGQSLNKKYVFGRKNSITGETENGLMIWELPSGKRVPMEIKIKDIYSMMLPEISPSGKYLAYTSLLENKINIHSFPDGKLLFELNTRSDYTQGIVFSQDEKRLITFSMNGTKKLWNLETGIEIATLIDIDKDNYAIVTNDQYYYCTKNASKFVHFVKDMKVYPFEQFDIKFNRPDIIMERLAIENPDLLKAFQLAYKKRLTKMGFTEEQLNGDLHLSTVEIVNSNEIPGFCKKDKINLKLKLKDEKYTLNRLMIRINGVPLNGIKGIDLKSKKSKEIKLDSEINLSEGKNHIEVSVINEMGTESIAEILNINYEGTKEKPILYVVTYGASKYMDSRFNLNYAMKDAEDVSEFFKSGNQFKAIKSLVLGNETATTQCLEKIQEFLKPSTINDNVIVFFAGHGVLDQNLNYYLGTYNMDFENPSEYGLPYEKVEEILNNIAARNKLLLLDACHSGELDKEEIAISKTEVSKDENIQFRSIPGIGVKKIGFNNSFELMKEIFTDLRKGNGTIVISSAGGAEYAIEGEQWKNGVFTYCLLKGLRDKKADSNNDGKIMVSELQNYLQAEVFQLTNGKQKPNSRVENLSNDWCVW